VPSTYQGFSRLVFKFFSHFFFSKLVTAGENSYKRKELCFTFTIFGVVTYLPIIAFPIWQVFRNVLINQASFATGSRKKKSWSIQAEKIALENLTPIG